MPTALDPYSVMTAMSVSRNGLAVWARACSKRSSHEMQGDKTDDVTCNKRGQQFISAFCEFLNNKVREVLNLLHMALESEADELQVRETALNA